MTNNEIDSEQYDNKTETIVDLDSKSKSFESSIEFFDSAPYHKYE